MSWFQYNTTPGANTSVDGINVAEGMPPGNVNNAMRAMMADSRKFQLDVSGAPVTGGTGDNYTLTVNQNFTGYAAGMRFAFRFSRANTTATPTLNVNGQGSRSLLMYRGGQALPPAIGDIPENAVVDVIWSQPDNGFILQNSFRTRPFDIFSSGLAIIGRPEAGAGFHSLLGLGNGIGFSGTQVVALIGAGLQFVNGRIAAVVSRFATDVEARAGSDNTVAMTPLNTLQFANANLLGMFQAWVDVTGSRSANTTYTNNTGKPIMVSIQAQSGSLQVAIAGSANWIEVGNFAQNVDGRQHQTAIVPNNHVYRALCNQVYTWKELR